MVPIFGDRAARSPFSATVHDSGGTLYRDGHAIAEFDFPKTPRFYAESTSDGIPYWKIATLHSHDVLATTVLQHCVRYGDRKTSCQFCAIGESLKAERTIARKRPEQLAEVAEAAVRLDGVTHMVMTTGTPATADRGAAILSASARAVRARVDLPIQAQCEPPDDPAWFGRMRNAGIDTLGMHVEAVTPEVRTRIMPGKAEVSVEGYITAFQQAVEVFGRGQVTTYILAGLGDTPESILAFCGRVVPMGVYPFVVPFVPVQGTPLADAPPPSVTLMSEIIRPLAALLAEHGLRSQDIRAGCGRCGACSTLRGIERLRVEAT